MDIAALLDQAAARFGTPVNMNCADMIATENTNIDSMMNRLEKRIDDKIDTKLGPVVDRLTALEPVVCGLTALENAVSSSTRSGPSSASDHGAGIYGGGGGGASPAVFALSYLEIKGWCGFRDRAVHGLTEVQSKEFTTKLRAGIGADLDATVARAGALRVRITKIMIYKKNPSLTNSRQIRDAMNAYIEKEDIKMGPQGTAPFVTEGKPARRQEQQRTLGKALGVAEQLATVKWKYLTSEWYPFYRVYIHESEGTPPMPLLSTALGATVATTEGV